jgi:pyrimidine operon attenuation protein / uracil phosphoribosyltransferase
MSRIVLSADDVSRSLKRIAHEIIESVSDSENIVVLGIPTRGVYLAKRLTDLLDSLNPGFTVKYGVLDVTMYRDDTVSPDRTIVETHIPPSGLDGETVILVDDVLYSGRTIRAALDAITDFGRPSQVKLAVIVDRGHRELPIRPDFVGKNLPTSSLERVHVKILEIDGIDEVVIES